MIRDMCEKTGAWLEGEEAIKQSIRRTIITVLGSKVLNRSFGSKVRRYLNRPIEEVKANITQEIFIALADKVKSFTPDTVEFASASEEENGILKIYVNGHVDGWELKTDAIELRT